MPPQFTQNLISIEKIEPSLQIEPTLFVLFTVLSCFLIYAIGLRNLSKERHRNLRDLFKNLVGHLSVASILLLIFWILRGGESISAPQIVPYIGLAAVLWGSLVIIKTVRIFFFEYLFFMNMQTGVPVLLVNMLTLLVTIVLGSWIATSVFGFRLAPVLATSALFSIVLGLALQDTLGNLFSGIALQIDKPYFLGDWVDVQTSDQRFTGRIYEITWRATILISLTEEWITIPNRVMAQSQILNYSRTKKPIIQSQIFRISYQESITEIKSTLSSAIEDLPGISRYMQPKVFIVEASESWITLKLIYCLKNFPERAQVADQVFERSLHALRSKNINLAMPRLTIYSENTASSKTQNLPIS